ncbi:MAG: hypothetical protein P4L55_14885 [Syntrophobacteraceae bacterium]|nr:hypothetical protein [Syntrophobacteraceae bacterium]
MEKPRELLREGALPESGSQGAGSEKRVIVSLVALFGIIATAALVLLYIVPYYGFRSISVHLPLIMGVLTGLAGAVLLGSLLLLAAVFALGRDIFFSRKLRSVPYGCCCRS